MNQPGVPLSSSKSERGELREMAGAKDTLAPKIVKQKRQEWSAFALLILLKKGGGNS